MSSDSNRVVLPPEPGERVETVVSAYYQACGFLDRPHAIDLSVLPEFIDELIVKGFADRFPAYTFDLLLADIGNEHLTHHRRVIKFDILGSWLWHLAYDSWVARTERDTARLRRLFVLWANAGGR